MDQNQQTNGDKRARSSEPTGPLIQDDDTISLVDLLDNLLYYRWYFVGVTILAVVLSAAYAIMATPIYTADTLIQVEEKKGTSMIGALDQVANPYLLNPRQWSAKLKFCVLALSSVMLSND